MCNILKMVLPFCQQKFFRGRFFAPLLEAKSACQTFAAAAVRERGGIVWRAELCYYLPKTSRVVSECGGAGDESDFPRRGPFRGGVHTPRVGVRGGGARTAARA